MGDHEAYAPETEANVVAAGEVIARLARVGAPLADWTIGRGPDSAVFPALEGRATEPVVRAYAQRWNVEAYDPMQEFEPGKVLFAETETHGIHVRVWAHTDQRLSVVAEEPRTLATTRRAEPGELCTCGRPAVDVFITEDLDEVGYCGQEGSRQFPVLPCPWCGATEPHREPLGDRGKCPDYQVRPKKVPDRMG